MVTLLHTSCFFLRALLLARPLLRVAR